MVYSEITAIIIALVDLVIPGNLHVSGCHCILTRHPGSKVTLKDTSSNGTLLNGKRLDKNIEVYCVVYYMYTEVCPVVSYMDYIEVYPLMYSLLLQHMHI